MSPDRLCMVGWSDYECRLFVSYSPLHHVDLIRQRMERTVHQKYIAQGHASFFCLLDCLYQNYRNDRACSSGLVYVLVLLICLGILYKTQGFIHKLHLLSIGLLLVLFISCCNNCLRWTPYLSFVTRNGIRLYCLPL